MRSFRDVEVIAYFLQSDIRGTEDAPHDRDDDLFILTPTSLEMPSIRTKRLELRDSPRGPGGEQTVTSVSVPLNRIAEVRADWRQSALGAGVTNVKVSFSVQGTEGKTLGVTSSNDHDHSQALRFAKSCQEAIRI